MNSNVLILDGLSNLLELLKDVIDLDNSVKSLKRSCRIPPKKNIYIVHFSTSEEHLEIYNKIKMEIETLDTKAVVKRVEYMGDVEEGIGHFLFVHSNNNINILHKL